MNAYDLTYVLLAIAAMIFWIHIMLSTKSTNK